jgi:rubrerythrin
MEVQFVLNTETYMKKLTHKYLVDKAYRESHKQQISERKRIWRESHKLHIAEWGMRYRAAIGKEKLANYGQTYREKNREKLLIKKKIWREKNPDKYRRILDRYDENHPDAVVAVRILNGGIRAKRIVKPKYCSACGKTGLIHGHHPDYSKPLEVVWLCPKCHTMAHRFSDAIGEALITRLVA